MRSSPSGSTWTSNWRTTTCGVRAAGSAKGKAIPRVLRQVDPELCEKYCRSFTTLFTEGDAADVIRLAEEVLLPAGGPLFDGYRADAPSAWRKTSA